MNKKQRSSYSATATRQLKRLENEFVPAIYGSLRTYVLGFVNDMKSIGITAAKGKLDRIIMIDGMAEVIKDLYVRGGLFFGKKAWKEIEASTKAANFGFDELWTADIIAYFRQKLLDSAVLPISQTTREQIESILTLGQQNGWGIEEMSRRMESPDFLLWRARMIARTEMVKAAAYGRQLSQRDNEWQTNKEWVATMDHRTRHAHMLVDGEVVASESRFNVGGEMMTGPGDPTASAGNVINCRCTCAVVAARDKDGRLIRKNPGIKIIMPGELRRPVQTISI